MDTTPAFQSSANPNQQEAIRHTNGPLLIIAGPGSGKTFTLVERIVYLISSHNVSPDKLLILTFTDKAAAELRTRISNRLTEMNIRFNLNEMYLGTFHSICLRILEEFREFTRLRRNYSLMDEFDQQYFLYQKQKKFESISNLELVTGDPGRTSSWALSDRLLNWINKISEEAVDPDELIKSHYPEIKALGEACNLYHQLLSDENALDFSTIQFETLNLLRTHQTIKNILRERFEFVMVDEYQDTNTIQELILREVTGENPNLCVVGDDDQGLYRFRGASIRNILQFRDQFAGGCAEVTLSTNYRSHPDIIARYDTWMGGHFWVHEGTAFRLEKTIEPRTDKQFPETATALCLSGHSPEAWHNEVLDLINTLRDKGGLKDLNQIAFLFRSVKNDKAVALAEFLEESGIPVYSPRSNMFFDREEVRLMLGALIFLFPQYPSIRKWHPEIDLSIWDYYDNHCVRPFLEQIKSPENQELREWIIPLARRNQKLAQNTDYAFADLFYQLLQFPLFSRYLGYDATGNVRESRAGRNLAIFSKLLSKFQYLHNVVVLQAKDVDDKVTQLFNQFFRFLKDGGINEYEDVSEYAPSGCVSFLTIHQSKGLEFPVVFVGSMEAVPYKQHSDIDEILQSEYYHRPPFEPIEKTKYYDFWRLYYTAFSRAQNLLVLTAETKAPGRGQRRVPSSYLEGIWNALPDWKESVFRPELLELEPVKTVNLKREYSFTSDIILFENCAEQYRFFRQLEFAPIRTSPILFGTLVHQTIEDIHKTVLRGEEQTIDEDRIRSWFEINYAALSKKERVYLSEYPRMAALEQVLRYYRRENHDWSRLKEAEVDVSLVKDEYILAGTIDLIRDENAAPNTVEIVDFKSEKKPDLIEEREKIERYRRQLEVYSHIVAERTGLNVSRMHLYYTSEESGSPYITFPNDEVSIGKTIESFDGIVSRIENRDFAIAERPKKLCRNCDMRFYCDAKEKQI
ncbi:MAG: ATP-dependent helicase [Pyrinomonadaceae bacterium]